ncbi:hypothetical protein BDD12DRAFT_803127 [Trichophaea hybrida]|nr:hypothetical protein BDD12DRAFT_803127 [Trichophaea hybrida]
MAKGTVMLVNMDVKHRIYLEESRGRTYTSTKPETNIIIHHMWNLGLSNIGDKGQMGKLFLECTWESGTIARYNKITTKKMFQDNEQDVLASVRHLLVCLNAFKNYTGVWGTMAEHSLYPENDSEGVEEELLF